MATAYKNKNICCDNLSGDNDLGHVKLVLSASKQLHRIVLGQTGLGQSNFLSEHTDRNAEL